jgi:adenosine deaminase
MDWTSIEAIKTVPKADLHVHLAGCIPAAVVRELLEEFVDPFSAAPDGPLDFSLLPILEPVSSLGHYLQAWRLLDRLPRGQANLKQIFLAVLSDFRADGVVYAEFRHSPLRIARLNNIALETALVWALSALDDAMAAVPGIDARVIFGIDRTAVDLAGIQAVLDAFKALGCPRQLVGLDVAGDEAAHPIGDELARLIRTAADELGLGVTIHAGETGPAENVRHAIEACGATRIGHGLAVVQSDPVLDLVRRRNVTLEVCLRSNVLTSSVRSLEEHPVLSLIEREIPFVLCADNPGVHAFSLSQEYRQFHALSGRADILEAMFGRQTAVAFGDVEQATPPLGQDHCGPCTLQQRSKRDDRSNPLGQRRSSR